MDGNLEQEMVKELERVQALVALQNRVKDLEDRLHAINIMARREVNTPTPSVLRIREIIQTSNI